MHFIKFLKNVNNQVFNIGSDNEITMIDLARKVKKICNSKSKIIFNSKNLQKLVVMRIF